MKEIFDELNLKNGSNYKLEVLKKHKDNEVLQRVLKMTYDHVEFTYGVSLQNIKKFVPDEDVKHNLGQALDVLEYEIATRNVTGNKANQVLANCLDSLSADDTYVLERVIDRNIRCNVGRTQINKVWPGLITKQIYMRCGVYNDKTKKKIIFPAMLQLKADGTYREFTVNGGDVIAKSRSGETYEYPIHFELMKNFPDGVYTGELTVEGVTDRAIGNGMINSSNPEHDKIVFDVWDFISIEEYKNAGTKTKNSDTYKTRFRVLNEIISQNKTPRIKVIDYKNVDTIQEALKQTSEWMSKGFEGAVLKNLHGLFKDGTSADQLKLKLCIDAEMRVVDFAEGKAGTKREGKVGAIIFENDDGTVKGRTSGFSDKLLDDMTVNPDKYIGKIITVQFNDLSKSEANDYYALSHPRFMEFRDDKDETDTLEKCFELREMAMNLGTK